jgi:hypothetical protein
VILWIAAPQAARNDGSVVFLDCFILFRCACNDEYFHIDACFCHCDCELAKQEAIHTFNNQKALL